MPLTRQHIDERAAALYISHGMTVARAVKERAAIAAVGGHVIETDKVLLWGFPAKYAKLHKGIRIQRVSSDDTADTWVVWAAVGKLTDIVQLIPYPLPLVAFVRQNKKGDRKGRAYILQDILRLCAGQQ